MSYTEYDAAQAAARAEAMTSWPADMCLGAVRNDLHPPGAPMPLPDANAAWTQATEKMTQGTPPAGAPVYFEGFAHGHIALSLGGGHIRSTDWPNKGEVGTTTINDLCAAWYGSQSNYRGWSRDYASLQIKGLEAAVAPAPAPSPRIGPWKGVDVSRYTALGTVKADATADDFELVMCTEGKGYNDPEYGAQMALVRAGTAHAGAVHYAWPQNGWQADYNHFKAQAGLRVGEAGALDFEPWASSQPSADPATFPAYVVGWTQQFRKDFGVSPLFYAPDYFVNLIKQHATAAQWAIISELAFWKAGKNGGYVSDPSVGFGSNLGFPHLVLWQWSDRPLDQDILYVPWSSIAVRPAGSAPAPTPTPTSTDLSGVPVVFIKPPSSSTLYVVKAGDTLSAIASAHHVTVAQLVAWNHIANPNVIQVGEHIRLTAPTASTTSGSYTVKSGDTLGALASKFHTTVSLLAKWNHIADVNLIHVGERLLIGKSASGVVVQAAHRYYTVQHGDTLGGIASKFHTTVGQLTSWNALSNPNLIYPGQRFRVG